MSSTKPKTIYFVEDLQAELEIGEHAAYKLAHEIGRRLGDRRWVVHRDVLEAYLKTSAPESSS
jgi:hypothetical protein